MEKKDDAKGLELYVDVMEELVCLYDEPAWCARCPGLSLGRS